MVTGAFVGNSVENTGVGFIVFDLVGATLVGDIVGEPLGLSVGLAVGSGVGLAVGSNVGNKVSSKSVGLKVGPCDGGTGVGFEVRPGDFAGVGF